MKKTKIIFIGNVINSYILLKTLTKFSSKYEVFVITNKNKKKSDFFDLSQFCKEKKINFYLTKDCNDEITYNWIKKINPDYIFCFGWSQILKKRIIKQAKKFCIGFHPAELPYNRGKHPIIWAIVLGLKKTASTFFVMGDKVDNGQILSQKIIKITPSDNATKLYKKISLTSSKQLHDLLKKLNKIKTKKVKFKSQISNLWRKRNFVDGVVDWRMNAKNIMNLVNALKSPYPYASFNYKKKFIKILNASIIKNINKNDEYGKVIFIKNSNPVIKCGDFAIMLSKTKPKIKIKKGIYL